MKANRSPYPQIALGAVAALSVLVGGCVAPVQTPVAAPPPVRRLPPLTPRAAAPADWQDMPATPGVWRWRREDSLSIARFGIADQPARFSMICDPRAGTVALSHGGNPPVTAATMSIHTTSLSRTLAMPPDPRGVMSAIVPAGDPLLDAMAYSRGRFAVEMPGTAPLYLPSWPEVSRVIEDCR